MYGGMHPLVSVPPMGGPIDPYCYPALPGPPAFVPQVPQVGAVPGRHPVPPIHAAAAQPPAGAAFPPVAAAAGATPCLTEVVHIWVPNNIVGALIGTKGVHIRNIMRLTGAHIRIESTKNEAGASGDQAQQPEKEEESAQQQPQNQGAGDRQQSSETERRVTITGTDQQQYKVSATYLSWISCWVDLLILHIEVGVSEKRAEVGGGA